MRYQERVGCYIDTLVASSLRASIPEDNLVEHPKLVSLDDNAVLQNIVDTFEWHHVHFA